MLRLWFASLEKAESVYHDRKVARRRCIDLQCRTRKACLHGMITFNNER
jgi:hypothetical protein